MGQRCENPFDGIESAHEFLKVLSECVGEAKHDVENDVARESSLPSRRLDALRVALYNLEKLTIHMNRSVRILNDLRSLRRLLFNERTAGDYQPKIVEASTRNRPAESLVTVAPATARAPAKNRRVAAA